VLFVEGWKAVGDVDGLVVMVVRNGETGWWQLSLYSDANRVKDFSCWGSLRRGGGTQNAWFELEEGP